MFTELRIGNIIKLNGQVCKVYSLSDMYGVCEVNGVTIVKNKGEISSIPLTKVLLEELQIAFHTALQDYHHKQLCAFFWDSMIAFKFYPYGRGKEGKEGVQLGYDYEYFHQLQNLHFILIGRELKLPQQYDSL